MRWLGGLMCVVVLAEGGWLAADRDRSAPLERSFAVVPPPPELELPAFYTKCVLVEGFPIVGSDRVHDAALSEAAWLIEQMIGSRTDVLEALAESGTRFTVMAVDEMTTDVPEHSDLTPSRFWDRRARGLGATPQRPCVSCGEENLLRFPGDPYEAENILVHEFAHAIHEMGLNQIDPEFDQRLTAIYEHAMNEGLWKDKYAANNRMEYWAEGVQSYFDTNRPPDHDHNHVDTRDELAEYDPRLFALIDEVFQKNTWRYTRPDEREAGGRAHLAGYDPETAPTFHWPAGLQEWYDEYQKKQAAERSGK